MRSPRVLAKHGLVASKYCFRDLSWLLDLAAVADTVVRVLTALRQEVILAFVCRNKFEGLSVGCGRKQ